MAIELKLSRTSRVYRPSEAVEGKIIVKSNSSISHYGIRLNVNGSVNLQVRGGPLGAVESLYGVVKPIPIVNKTVEVKPSGTISSGTTEIPFSVILRKQGEENLEKFYETFHGANISIQYLLTVDIMRGYLHRSLSSTVEFIVESDKGDLLERPISPEVILFYITQDTQRHPLLPELKSGLLVATHVALYAFPFLFSFLFYFIFFPSRFLAFLIGGFRVTGRMTTECVITDAISGELTVEASAVPIGSIDILLFCVESILLGERIATKTSLIQTTQACNMSSLIADGDVCRNMTLPIYVILPRLLTCPTVFAGPFSIEFKVSIVISFQSKLSKLHSKSDPGTPRLWVSTGSSFYQSSIRRWKLYHLNWFEQSEM
ncbi:hypothetical protein FEM48_Zijuj05G0083900 [Ziziphus jujuba var. spinosa]|uniref:Vacuolar protein sorting-associated protein 26C n=1 Tax=Ziziphus jujuba var. spinosa TaxID=714518 RepID=A0A978VDW0_ZIZJJ|nr:hypothetical protein FEM48_Zijuj05G0083900 [Ziziphus jujuba var. spinosa]